MSYYEDLIKEMIAKKFSKESLEGRIKDVPIGKDGKCKAHLYILNNRGNNYYTYRCIREGCRHYATFADIEGRYAMCIDCGFKFSVENKHIIKDKWAEQLTDKYFERPVCGCIQLARDQEAIRKAKEEGDKKNQEKKELNEDDILPEE